MTRAKRAHAHDLTRSMTGFPSVIALNYQSVCILQHGKFPYRADGLNDAGRGNDCVRRKPAGRGRAWGRPKYRATLTGRSTCKVRAGSERLANIVSGGSGGVTPLPRMPWTLSCHGRTVPGL